jgi:NB-ARC domain
MIGEDLLVTTIGALLESIFSVVIDDVAQRPVFAPMRERIQNAIDPTRKAFAHALKVGFRAFEKDNPELAASLIDDVFLKEKRVAREFAKLLRPGQEIDITLLANAWYDSVTSLPIKRDPEALREPMTTFINTIKTEVHAQPELQDFTTNDLLTRVIEALSKELEAAKQSNKYLEEIRDLLKVFTDASAREQFAQLDAPQEAAYRPGSADALLITDPDDLRERPRKLFGRDALLTEILSLLKSGERVLLQGFGGMGKTALAAEAAGQWIKIGKGQVLWLKMGSSSVDALLEALARPFGQVQAIARESGESKIRAMRQLLRDSGVTLLVLDDCWNGAALHTLLQAVPRDLPVLMTARQRYPIDGQIREVEALAPGDALALLGYHAGWPSLPTLSGVGIRATPPPNPLPASGEGEQNKGLQVGEIGVNDKNLPLKEGPGEGLS